jgi:hypothetical protein
LLNDAARTSCAPVGASQFPDGSVSHGPDFRDSSSSVRSIASIDERAWRKCLRHDPGTPAINDVMRRGNPFRVALRRRQSDQNIGSENDCGEIKPDEIHPS